MGDKLPEDGCRWRDLRVVPRLWHSHKSTSGRARVETLIHWRSRREEDSSLQMEPHRASELPAVLPLLLGRRGPGRGGTFFPFTTVHWRAEPCSGLSKDQRLLPSAPKILKQTLTVHVAGFLFLLVILLAWTGCGRKNDIKPAVSELEKAFAVSAAATPAAAVPPDTLAQAKAGDAHALVRVALSSVASNDYAAGVIALQAVQRIPGVTAQQLMAAEQAKQALTADLVVRADRGDAKAKAELDAIEKTLSQ
jgi:hypothetical protein